MISSAVRSTIVQIPRSYDRLKDQTAVNAP